jgi:tetratricopeptide (TPR) repeat protein
MSSSRSSGRLEDSEILAREHESQRGPLARSSCHREGRRVRQPAQAGAPAHQAIAERLAAEGHRSWAADHLELGALASLDLDAEDRALPEAAADALVSAADRARRRMESRTAADYYERALALAGPEGRWGVREARALAGLGEARYWLGEYPAATSALERAVELGHASRDAFALALALRFLGDIAINVEADVDKAEKLLDESLAYAEELGDPWSITRTLLFAGWVPWTRERSEDAEAIWRRALEVADPEDGWARVRALNSLSINRTGGPHDPSPTGQRILREALAVSDEASALAEEIGDPFSIAITTVQRARILEDLGRLDESLASLDRAIPIFEELGARWELGDATAERGVTKRELGRLDDAEDDLRAAIISAHEELGSARWRAGPGGARAGLEARGDHAEAERRHRRSREAQAQGPR